MVRRKLIIPLVALATLALMLSATGASAKPHETIGELHTECVVNGTVDLDGLDNNPSNNKYKFRDTALTCVGEKGGTYDVEAEGETADFWHHDPDHPGKDVVIGGEDCDQGGSRKIEDEVHSGSLTAKSAALNMAGKVHFVRLATTVLADGPLYKDTLVVPDPQPEDPDNWFQAELEFIPTQGTCSKEDPVTQASLTGTAEIFDGSADHDCGEDNEKTGHNDKDCDKIL